MSNFIPVLMSSVKKHCCQRSSLRLWFRVDSCECNMQYSGFYNRDNHAGVDKVFSSSRKFLFIYPIYQARRKRCGMAARLQIFGAATAAAVAAPKICRERERKGREGRKEREKRGKNRERRKRKERERERERKGREGRKEREKRRKNRQRRKRERRARD